MMDFSFHRPRYSTSSLSSASTSTSSSAALSHPGSSIFTPLSFFDGEEDTSSADTERPGGTGMDRDYEYVKWQGSQTACHALNQLIDSSKDESESMRARGSWQREPSFDQIPGFSMLSTADTPSSIFESPLLAPKLKHKSTSASTSAGPSSRPPSRSRLSETRPRPSSSSSAAPDTDVTNLPLPAPIPPPFFDKANPEKLLRIIKGVAKRVDENAGLHPRARKSASSTSVMHTEEASTSVAAGPTAQKRSRVQSLRSGTSESSKDTRRKKSRLGTEEGNKNKEKRREEQNDDVKMEMGVPPKTPSQLRMPPPAPPVVHLTQRNLKQQDPHQSSSSPSSLSSRQSTARPAQPTSTPSEPTRTPKLHPLLLQQPAEKGAISSSSSSATATSSYLPQTDIYTSYPKPQASSSTSHQVQLKAYPSGPSSKARYQANAGPSPILTSVPTASNPAPQPLSGLVPPGMPVPEVIPPPAPAQPTSTPSSSYTSRPPPLGMRRTHTYPSSMQKKGELPTKQKGFKPPLLAASEPQSQPQSAQVQPRVKIEKASAVGTGAVPTGKPISKQSTLPSSSFSASSASASSSSVHHSSVLTSSNSATAHTAASTLAFSSSSSKNRQRKPPTSSVTSHSAMSTQHQHQPVPFKAAPAPTIPSIPAPQAATRVSIAQPLPRAPAPAVAERAAVASPPPPPEPIPEPTDGDTDSSFGDIDMSFDMDALEETMKLYD